MRMEMFIQDRDGRAANIAVSVYREIFGEHNYSGEWRLQSPNNALPRPADRGTVGGRADQVHLTCASPARVHTLLTLRHFRDRSSEAHVAETLTRVLFISVVGIPIGYATNMLPNEAFAVARSGDVTIHPDIENFGHGFLKPGQGCWSIVHLNTG
jgi:hypothetical protein